MKRSELKQLIREVIEEVGGSSDQTLYKRWKSSLAELGSVQEKFMEELGRKISSELAKARIFNRPGSSYQYDPIIPISSYHPGRASPTQRLYFKKVKKSGDERIYSINLSFAENKATISVSTFGEQNYVKEDVTNAKKISDILDAIEKGMQKIENDEGGGESSGGEIQGFDTSFN